MGVKVKVLDCITHGFLGFVILKISIINPFNEQKQIIYEKVLKCILLMYPLNFVSTFLNANNDIIILIFYVKN